MKLRSFLFLCCVLGTASAFNAAAQRPVANGDDVVRVGTWNLEHFGARPGLPPRSPEQIQAIAAFLDELGVDVLALQEIQKSTAVESLVRALGPSWKFLIGTTGGYRDGTGGIRLGFLWNDDVVELVQAEELLQLPSEVDTFPIFHRKPVSAVFRARVGGLDFRAITVHLKASRKQKDIAKRVREVTALRSYLEQLLADEQEDRDVLILGDFNHTYRAPAYHSFTKGGFVEYLKPSRGRPRTIVHFDDPIDHVAVLAGLREELVTRHVTVHHEQADRDLVAWRATYSDHIPVTIDLRASPDRDPDATFAPPRPDQWLRAGGLAATTMPAAAANARAGDAATAATAAGSGTRAAESDASFAPGTHVEVRWLPGSPTGAETRSFGTLLSSLGDWVVLREDRDGSNLAIPRERVVQVRVVTR